PYKKNTPLGLFVVQDKMIEMQYYEDGTKEIGGYAPYASRFSAGGYIHGIPVNLPATGMIEYSPTLGTTPRSHMCVRNATSHAEYIYDWADKDYALVAVIE
ncbi:MAG: L,D-transpeptidase, partial [Bacteroidales bacterium]